MAGRASKKASVRTTNIRIPDRIYRRAKRVVDRGDMGVRSLNEFFIVAAEEKLAKDRGIDAGCRLRRHVE